MKQRIVWILLGLMVFMSSVVMAAPAENAAPGSRIKDLLAEWRKGDVKPATGNRLPGKVGLVWQPRLDDATDMSEAERIDCINVVSPCWFRISSEDGTMSHAALSPDKDYVKKAKKKGYKVWALVSNSFDPDMTHRLLANPAGMKRAIDEIMQAVKKYDLDGINLDFENIEEEDRDALSGFISRLGAELHKENKTFSVKLEIGVTVKDFQPSDGKSFAGPYGYQLQGDDKSACETTLKNEIVGFFLEMQQKDVDVFAVRQNFYSRFGPSALRIPLSDIKFDLQVQLKVKK